MKFLILISLFLTNILFANYSYTNQNSGQIDMHGGKSDNLTGGLKSLGSIKKPLAPIAPAPLIKQEEKTEKIEEKTKEETK